MIANAEPTLPLEQVVAKLTGQLAELYGLDDRGVIAVGKRADISVIDFDRLKSALPWMLFDLPKGGPRSCCNIRAATGRRWSTASLPVAMTRRQARRPVGLSVAAKSPPLLRRSCNPPDPDRKARVGWTSAAPPISSASNNPRRALSAPPTVDR